MGLSSRARIFSVPVFKSNPTIPLTDIPEEEEPAENPFCPDFISYDKMLDIVESLPEGYCKVFKLAVLEGLSHKEIGDLLGIAPHSSSSQLFRAKILLKKMLAGYRVFIVLTALLLFPTLYDYLYREKKTLVFLGKVGLGISKNHLKEGSLETYDFVFLNDIFNKDFKTVTFDMYAIYLNVGFGYAF